MLIRNRGILVNLGQFIYKDRSGNIVVCDHEHLIEKYEENYKIKRTRKITKRGSVAKVLFRLF